MNKIFNFFKEKYNSSMPLKIEWIIGILIAAVMLIMFVYVDLISLTIWSTNMLDCIADGKLNEYFKYTALNLHHIPHQYVSGTLYSLIAWGIWNIPIWIGQRYLGFEILDSASFLLWSKLFLVFALILTLVYTYKMIMYLTKDKVGAKWGIFLSLTYIFTYIGVFYAGQNDILICLLGTMALYYLMKKKNKLFYILAGFAISVKYFFFIPFVIIMFLIEKNLLKVVRNIFYGLIPTIVFRIVCSGLPMYAESASASPYDGMLSGLFKGSIPVVGGQQLSLLLVAFAALVFIAYKTVPKSDKERNEYIIYLTTASFILLLMFSSQTFYRPILLMPFMFILFAINKDRFRFNVILETIATVSLLILECFVAEYYFMATDAMYDSVLSRIVNLDLSLQFTPHAFLLELLPSYFNMLCRFFATLTFISFALILIINYPKKKMKFDVESKKPERYIIWIRLCALVPIIWYLLHITII